MGARDGDAANITHLVPGGGLTAHQGLDGGHTLAQHVGKTEQFLRNRLATRPDLDAASTFLNRQVAESALSEVLGANAREISRWLAGNTKTLVLVARMSHPVGAVVGRKSAGPVLGRGIKLVLKRSSAFATGYRIHTAMVEL
jgi:hypothetical protein